MNKLLAIVGLVLVLSPGCKKPGGGTTSVGGKGGSAVLSVTPEHHGEFVDTCTLYIKYNTQDAPADGMYDDSAVCMKVDTTPVATFSGLKNGNYYLFAKGFHSLYTPPYVKGGVKYTIATQAQFSVIVPTYSYNP